MSKTEGSECFLRFWFPADLYGTYKDSTRLCPTGPESKCSGLLGSYVGSLLQLVFPDKRGWKVFQDTGHLGLSPGPEFSR